MRRNWSSLLAALAVLPALSQPALALSCSGPPGSAAAIREEFASSPLIFIGRSVATANAPCREAIIQHRMTIVEVLKGTLSPPAAADGTVVVAQHVWPGCASDGRPMHVQASPEPLLFFTRPPAGVELAAMGVHLGRAASVALSVCSLGQSLDSPKPPELKAVHDALIAELRAARAKAGK